MQCIIHYVTVLYRSVAQIRNKTLVNSVIQIRNINFLLTMLYKIKNNFENSGLESGMCVISLSSIEFAH